MGDIHGQNIGHNHSLQKRYLSFYIHYINTVSFKQKGYCWTARTGRKMPKKCLGHVFKTLSAPHDVVQLSVNFWHLCLLGLGANLVLGSILVGNHLCKVAPKSENSLLSFFRVAMGSGPLEEQAKNFHFHFDLCTTTDKCRWQKTFCAFDGFCWHRYFCTCPSFILLPFFKPKFMFYLCTQIETFFIREALI